MKQPFSNHELTFEQAYQRMVVRRNGQEQAFLHVTFLRKGRVVKEQILEDKYACRRMADWTARGPEFAVSNDPVQLPRFGVQAVLFQQRAYRAQARRFAA